VNITLLAFFVGTIFNASLFTVAKDESYDGPPTWLVYVAGINASIFPDAWEMNVANWPDALNINVTGWPTEKRYVFFQYRFNTTLKCYTSPIDHSTYGTSYPHTNWYHKKNYMIDTRDFDSGLSSALMFEIELYAYPQPCNQGGYVKTVSNESTRVFGTPSTGNYKRICGSLRKGEINEVSVHIRSDCSDRKYKISDIKFNLYYVYDKKELTSGDFGVDTLYLKQLVLNPQETVILNNDPTQTVTNFGDTTMTYEFTERISLGHIEFLYGHPEILVYAEV